MRSGNRFRPLRTGTKRRGRGHKARECTASEKGKTREGKERERRKTTEARAPLYISEIGAVVARWRTGASGCRGEVEQQASVVSRSTIPETVLAWRDLVQRSDD